MAQNKRISDHRLDFLADRFIEEQIGRLLGITFYQYIASPKHYDAYLDALKNGHGLRINKAGAVRIVGKAAG